MTREPGNIGDGSVWQVAGWKQDVVRSILEQDTGRQGCHLPDKLRHLSAAASVTLVPRTARSTSPLDNGTKDERIQWSTSSNRVQAKVSGGGTCSAETRASPRAAGRTTMSGFNAGLGSHRSQNTSI